MALPSMVSDYLLRNDLTRDLTVRPMFMPDEFLDQASPARQLEWAGLDAAAIVRTAVEAMEKQASKTGNKPARA